MRGVDEGVVARLGVQRSIAASSDGRERKLRASGGAALGDVAGRR